MEAKNLSYEVSNRSIRIPKGKGKRMCGGSFARRGPRLESLGARWEDSGSGASGSSGGQGRLFGLDVESMAPRAQVATALTILAPVVLSGVLLVAFVPGLWWVFTTYGWIAFPAFGLLVRGVGGLPEGRTGSPPVESGERELLGALRRHGELTPTRAAMETSLSVAEADEMLRGLAEGGHLEVRVRGGALFYALWAGPRELEPGDGGDAT
jgi:hypothetical protein